MGRGARGGRRLSSHYSDGNAGRTAPPMKAMVLAKGKGTRLFPLIRRTVIVIRRLHAVSGVVENGRGKLYLTWGVRGGRARSWQGRQRRSQSTTLEYLGDVERRCREQTHPMRFHGRSLPPSTFCYKRRCFQAELQKAQRKVCQLCAA